MVQRAELVEEGSDGSFVGDIQDRMLDPTVSGVDRVARLGGSAAGHHDLGARGRRRAHRSQPHTAGAADHDDALTVQRWSRGGLGGAGLAAAGRCIWGLMERHRRASPRQAGGVRLGNRQVCLLI